MNGLKNISEIKRVILLINVLMLILATAAGCAGAVPDNADRIGKPFNAAPPLEGIWELQTDSDNGAEVLNESAHPLSGSMIGFTKDTLSLAGTIYNNVSYKIKRVNAGEYFLHKSNSAIKNKYLHDKEILIITAYSDDKFLYEFIKSSAGGIAASIDDKYYSMVKISDEFDAGKFITAQSEPSNSSEGAAESNSHSQSGLLLGVRTPVRTKDGIEDFVYKTYWISYSDTVLRPVLFAEDIFLPRMDGFWKLKMEKKMSMEGIEDFLHAYKVSKQDTDSYDRIGSPKTDRLEIKLRQAIMYVGNDYVCVESTIYDRLQDKSEEEGKKFLRTLPVDNLTNIEGIKISDLSGENGVMAMENAISSILKDTSANEAIRIDQNKQEMNFALFRKTGHWFFRGRLNFENGARVPYVDFNLNLIPPDNMVAYDMLHVPWTEMKDRLPNATDIYTSPNKDFAVILMRNEILIYGIKNKSLSEEPIARFSLEDGSSVIMAEWATGGYVSSWEKFFIKNNEATEVVTGDEGT